MRFIIFFFMSLGVAASTAWARDQHIEVCENLLANELTIHCRQASLDSRNPFLNYFSYEDFRLHLVLRKSTEPSLGGVVIGNALLRLSTANSPEVVQAVRYQAKNRQVRVVMPDLPELNLITPNVSIVFAPTGEVGSFVLSRSSPWGVERLNFACFVHHDRLSSQ